MFCRTDEQVSASKDRKQKAKERMVTTKKVIDVIGFKPATADNRAYLAPLSLRPNPALRLDFRYARNVI